MILCHLDTEKNSTDTPLYFPKIWWYSTSCINSFTKIVILNKIDQNPDNNKSMRRRDVAQSKIDILDLPNRVKLFDKNLNYNHS